MAIMRKARMTQEEKQNSIMAGFMIEHCGTFKKGDLYNPVTLHHGLVDYVTRNPEQGPVKYISSFPEGANGRLTKVVFKRFLDEILELPRNTRKFDYWIKDESVESRLNERIEQLAYQGKVGKLIVHLRIKQALGTDKV